MVEVGAWSVVGFNGSRDGVTVLLRLGETTTDGEVVGVVEFPDLKVRENKGLGRRCEGKDILVDFGEMESIETFGGCSTEERRGGRE